MPSFHIRQRLNRLRSSSSKSDPVGDSVTETSGNAEAPEYEIGETPSEKDHIFSSSSNFQTSRTSSSTHSLRQKDQPAASVTDPIGLTLVYSPGDGTIKADIVFIHGLGGTSRMTWSKDRNIRLFWPGEFLPLENELCQTRIFTFGYNADVKSGSRTSSSILTFAKDLLFDLNYALADETKGSRIGQVPLIFVAHSMGGLIVKEAYIHGQHDPDCSHIIKAVLAIIFLSTPHRGTNLAETLNRILQVSPLSTPKPYINELVQNSFTIQKINEQFRHIAPKLNIISFYETLPTSIVRGGGGIMVLERDSSVLGYPGEVSKALDADHHTVCKYDSRQDPKYLAVCNYLKSKVGSVFSQQARRSTSKLSVSSTQTGSTVPNLRTRDLLEIFGISEPFDADYIFFRDRWTLGTCQWILREPSFTKWLDGATHPSSLLWIHGLPGSGKSILSSYLVDYLAQNGHACQYFFLRQGDSRKRSLSSLLRSLAFQVTQSDPSFLQAIAKVSASITLRGADPRTIWQRIFRSVLFVQARSHPLFWVIDGLDECDDVRTSMKLLTEVLNYPVAIKILITSRWNSEIEGSLKRLSLEHGGTAETIAMQAHVEDCETFIRQELDWTHIPQFQQRISKQLLHQAEGSFLWTRLTVDRINRCHTAAAVEQALQELHPGMEDLYQQMASSISNLSPADTSLASNILLWVCCAQRRLTVLELAQALEPRNHDILDLQRSIIALCSGFVVLDNEGSVAMVHQTARDFLVKSKHKTFHVDRRQAHATIASRCFRLLNTPGLQRKIRKGQAPVLLSYAAHYLWAHLASCNPLTDTLIQALSKFLKGQDVFTWIQSLAQEGQLHVMVQASDYMSICADRLNIPEQSPVQQLLRCWATDLGKLVGKFGRQLLGHPECIHTTIAPFCPINSMIHKQLAHRVHQDITVSGVAKEWDDSVARLSFPAGYDALDMVSGGSMVAIAAMLDGVGRVILYRVDTHEEVQQLEHGERIRKIQLDQFGTMLVSCGYSTTKVWSLETGDCICQVRNPLTKPYPQTVAFDQDSNTIMIGTNDRRLWSIPVKTASPDGELETKYTQVTRIVERRGTNSPTCMAVSPDRQLLACGYRQLDVGLTIWDLESQESIACRHDLTRATQLVWHPHNGELFGLLQILCGQIFKWYPDEYQEPLIQYVEASTLAISDNGSVLAVGDHHGTVRLMSTDDLTVLAQVARQDPVLGLTFSSDGRQLYDLRRTHTNVWQPNILLKLAEPTPELSDLDSDSDGTLVVSDQEPPKKPMSSVQSSPLQTEKSHDASRIDPITAFSPRPFGTIYCIGTIGGVVTLHEASRPSHVLLELHRSKTSFSIQQIAWNTDGTKVCYADVGRTIRVDSIAVTGTTAQSTRLTRITIRQLRENITQVLFHPTAVDRLFVASMTTGVVITVCDSVPEAVIASTASTISDDDPAILTGGNGVSATPVRWLPHPWCDKYLMKVTDTEIAVLSWDTLENISIVPLRKPPSPETPTHIPGIGDSLKTTPPRAGVAPIPGSIRRSNTASLTTSASRTPLEAFVSPPSSGKIDRHGEDKIFHLLTCHYAPDSARSLSMSLWRLEHGGHVATRESELPEFLSKEAHKDSPSKRPSSSEKARGNDEGLTATEITLPPQIITSVARPLGFISSRTAGSRESSVSIVLVFLDRTSSICTWPIPSSDSTTGTGKLKTSRHPATRVSGSLDSGSTTPPTGSGTTHIGLAGDWGDDNGKGLQHDLAMRERHGNPLRLSHHRRNLVPRPESSYPVLGSNEGDSDGHHEPTAPSKDATSWTADSGSHLGMMDIVKGSSTGIIDNNGHLIPEPSPCRYHYSLPGDWVSFDAVRLFQLFPVPHRTGREQDTHQGGTIADAASGERTTSTGGTGSPGSRAPLSGDMLLACPSDGRVMVVGCNL